MLSLRPHTAAVAAALAHGRERRLIGGHPQRRLTSFSRQPTNTALRRPLESAQYTSVALGARCKEAGVRPSTGSVGDAYDNAMCESFFATLECELIDRRRFRTHSEARIAVFQFIEGFYNPSRRHSALGYLSPIEYERKHDGLSKPA
jgi:transposase InsO family protein